MRILIAEDDPRLLKSLIHIMKTNNYSVDGVSDGRTAFLLALSDEYDGLVLDIMMPEMDGIDLLKSLRDKGITTPALFLTARTEVEQRVEGLDAGAVSSVPVTNALLKNQVEAQTQQSEQVEQNFGRGGKMVTGAPIAETNYITEITNAADVTVIIEMLGIAVLLTLISGAVSMLFIMRYEPLKILANRD